MASAPHPGNDGSRSSLTPPPELFKQWEDDILNERDNVDHVLDCAWRDGYRAGADQELEACCEWLQDPDLNVDTYKLRAARRPKPPSLAERALIAQRCMWDGGSSHADWELIRTALERLQELENNG